MRLNDVLFFAKTNKDINIDGWEKLCLGMW